MKSEVSKSESGRSPFSGCAILIAALLVMVFLIGFSFVTLFRQFNEIAKVTGTSPAPLEITSLEGREADLNGLADRLDAFRQNLGGEMESVIALDPEELNLAIAAFEHFKDLRGTFRVISVEDDALRIAISFELNGKPRLATKEEGGWIRSDSRYLNAVMIARPTLLQREIVLKIDAIEVPGSTVPTEFIEQMSPYRITERYLTDPVLGPAMAKLTRAGIENGMLVLASKPGEQPFGIINKDDVDAASSRFFVILGSAASLFLIFAGIVIFIGLRAKARNP
jgi:hypothetical protein